MMVKISCIVEGHGEVDAVPILIRRVSRELYPDISIIVERPIRTPRTKVVKGNQFERAVELASRNLSGQGGIFILFDSDDSCPAELGPMLLHRALEVRGDLPIAVVLAKCEFETWFITSVESLREQRGLRNDILPPDNPEGIRNAKGWLTQQMEGSRRYRETLDQAAFAANFNLEQARQSNSFDKCYREIAWLLEELQKQQEN